MELWTCTIDDCHTSPVLLGIFSTKDKAKEQAETFMQGFNPPYTLRKVVDEGLSDEALCYHIEGTSAQYFVNIEQYHLDEFSY